MMDNICVKCQSTNQIHSMATGRCERCHCIIPEIGFAYCSKCARTLQACKHCGQAIQQQTTNNK